MNKKSLLIMGVVVLFAFGIYIYDNDLASESPVVKYVPQSGEDYLNIPNNCQVTQETMMRLVDGCTCCITQRDNSGKGGCVEPTSPLFPYNPVPGQYEPITHDCDDFAIDFCLANSHLDICKMLAFCFSDMDGRKICHTINYIEQGNQICIYEPQGEGHEIAGFPFPDVTPLCWDKRDVPRTRKEFEDWLKKITCGWYSSNPSSDPNCKLMFNLPLVSCGIICSQSQEGDQGVCRVSAGEAVYRAFCFCPYDDPDPNADCIWTPAFSLD